jgi:small-conductance mechanosensitive channel
VNVPRDTDETVVDDAAGALDPLAAAAAIGIVVVGIASAFAGPIDVSGVLAVAGCAGLAAATVGQTILLRRP